MYAALTDNIDVDDIAKNSNNRIVLRRLQRNNANDTNNALYLQNEHDEDWGEEDCDHYYPEGAYDMGWLGYFIGKNEHLQKLLITSFATSSGASVRDVMESFLRGVSFNKSIREINFDVVDLLGGEVFTMLGLFFKKKTVILPALISMIVTLEKREAVCLHWHLGVVHTNLCERCI